MTVNIVTGSMLREAGCRITTIASVRIKQVLMELRMLTCLSTSNGITTLLSGLQYQDIEISASTPRNCNPLSKVLKLINTSTSDILD